MIVVVVLLYITNTAEYYYYGGTCYSNDLNKIAQATFSQIDR